MEEEGKNCGESKKMLKKKKKSVFLDQNGHHEIFIRLFQFALFIHSWNIDTCKLQKKSAPRDCSNTSVSLNVISALWAY